MHRKRILTLTGTRADYGLMRPVLSAIKEDPQFEMTIIVSGMHFEKDFTTSLREVTQDNFGHLIYLDHSEHIKASNTMLGKMSFWMGELEKITLGIKPDLVLLQGDRGEMLALAIVAGHMNVPIAHMSGGDLTGSIDNSIRYAISAFSSLHLTTCHSSTTRLQNCLHLNGQIEEVGEPALDNVLSLPPMSTHEFRKIIGRNLDDGFILATFHPVTSETEMNYENATNFLMALGDTGKNILLTYPNTDEGSESVIEAIDLVRNNKNFTIIPNLGSRAYLYALQSSSCIVGNSSSGILEAALFGKPVVNIGTRQNGRERSENILDVDYSRKSILGAIEFALQDVAFKELCKKVESPYGNGDTATLTIEALKRFLKVPRYGI